MSSQLIAVCGRHCGTCQFYQATQAEDQAALEQLYTVFARLFPAATNVSVNAMKCDGCAAERRSFFCRNCAIRDCAEERRYRGCHVCEDFPCSTIETCPITGTLQAIQAWRANGTEALSRKQESVPFVLKSTDKQAGAG